MIYQDQLHRKLQLKTVPKRIISLVPSQTELLVDLGLEASIVGVTKFCIHPKHLKKEKTIIGGTKQVSIEKIKTLQPDIILCNKEENTAAIIEGLKPVAPIHISDIYNLEDCFELINQYGTLFKVENKAMSIIADIEKKRQQFQYILKGLPRPKVAYFIWKNPWMVAAKNTFIHTMLNEAGYKNLFEAETRYPEIALKDLASKQPDAIFLSTEPYPFKVEHISELKTQFPNTPIKIVDGELFSWYGSRLQKSYAYFEDLFNSI